MKILIGNSYSSNTQEVTVKGTKVLTKNAKIRNLIKDYLNGEIINQGCFFATRKSNYVILNVKDN